MGKNGIAKKDGSKKKHNNLLKKKKNKEVEAKLKRLVKLKEMNRIEKEANRSVDS